MDVRLPDNVPRPADKISIFVDAVSAKREAATVDRLYGKIIRSLLPQVDELTSGTIRELVYPPDEGR